MQTAEPRRVYLIGLMGSGKTTVGGQLAARLGWHYLDNDAAIAGLAGRSTVALAEEGGTLLHDWESRYVEHVQQLSPPFVCGIPASTADRPAELSTLRETGRLIYLRCDVETLVRRVTADQPRPWLAGEVHDTIAAMFAQRDPLLRAAAELTVDATRASAVIVDQLAGVDRPA